jgi:hypothetical protein
MRQSYPVRSKFCPLSHAISSLSRPQLSHVLQNLEHLLDCANLFLVRAHLSGDRFGLWYGAGQIKDWFGGVSEVGIDQVGLIRPVPA